MKKPLSIFALLLACCAPARAIETTAWRYQQPFDIAQAGAARVALPPETLDRLQPDLRDLRIVDTSGAELPYAVLELPSAHAAYETVSTVRRPVSLQIDTEKKEVVATIATETLAPLDSVELIIADTTDYMLPARVEISNNGSKWQTLSTGQALFRRGQGNRYGAVVQNTLSLNRLSVAYVRVTISTGETSLAITGADVRTINETAARESVPDDTVSATIVSTEQRPGETLLTIDLGAANLSLTTLLLDVSDPLFMRRVTFSSPDGRQIVPDQTIYRVEIANQVSTRKTTLAFGGAFIQTRQIIARIENGDSPPLNVRGVRATCRPVHIAFNPPAAGRFTFISGNAQTRAPRYDLAVLSDKLASLPLSKITAAAIIENPGYRADGPASASEQPNYANSAFFWLALAVVVIVLLVVVAKLLPKPKNKGDES